MKICAKFPDGYEASFNNAAIAVMVGCPNWLAVHKLIDGKVSDKIIALLPTGTRVYVKRTPEENAHWGKT